MRKIAIGFGLLGVVVSWSVQGASADANDKKLPPGYVLFPNAQGQNVPIKHATTYAQCVRNGHSLGYGDAQIETYCHEHYAH